MLLLKLGDICAHFVDGRLRVIPRPSSKSRIASYSDFSTSRAIAAAFEAKPVTSVSKFCSSEVPRDRGVTKGIEDTVVEAV